MAVYVSLTKRPPSASGIRRPGDSTEPRDYLLASWSKAGMSGRERDVGGPAASMRRTVVDDRLDRSMRQAVRPTSTVRADLRGESL